MQINKSFIEGVFEIVPNILKDDRGFFLETYHVDKVKAAGLEANFLQDNLSFSKKGVVRGLHLQKKPYAQGKYVKVVSGKALDVMVDLRKDSPTFGKHDAFILDGEKQNIVYIPEGFAHGFAALEDCYFTYKCTNVYNKESESGIIWNDSDLNIDWKVENPIVSDKDQALMSFAEIQKYLDEIY
ncbi:MAG: dTDP-4-dehydrorhamnose 3,5-epimerase [Cytophagales bacterium]